MLLGGEIGDGPRPTFHRSLINFALVAFVCLTWLILPLGVDLPRASAAESELASESCAAGGGTTEEPPKRINLVLDDSGSMFLSKGSNEQIQNWSYAKYALEVFAALMGPNDQLNVYRLSDFDSALNENPTFRPALQLVGSAQGADVKERVAQVHDMQLVGLGTPYVAVESAYEDLLRQTPGSEQNWLVILTDGVFEGQDGEKITSDKLQELMNEYAEQGEEELGNLRVALLALGKDVPGIRTNATQGIFGEKAANGGELLNKMGDFANIIFGRDGEFLSETNIWDPGTDAIDMAQVILFAQGEGVEIGSIRANDGVEVSPETSVNVKWSDNQDVVRQKTTYEALPDKDLNGEVAFFSDVAKGPIDFDLSPGKTGVAPYAFFKPQASLQVQLKDPSGNTVTASNPTQGEYVVEYGFVDSSCQFLDSKFLRDEYRNASLIVDGKVLLEGLERGETIEIPSGDVQIVVDATYLNGTPVTATYESQFVKAGFPSRIIGTDAEVNATELAQPVSIPMEYVVIEEGRERAPTEEEWALVGDTTFLAEADPAGLNLTVTKGTIPGDLQLIAEAPDGDIYSVPTGETAITISGTYAVDRPELAAQETQILNVNQDYSAIDKLLNWFKTVGWKLLLALLALLILLGYLFKKRFSKKIKNRPSIQATPKTVGSLEEVSYNGKFERNSLRRFLPFVADTATLKYVPNGEHGFRNLKLKAGPGKTMVVTNWQEIAKGNNTSINGNLLNEDTKRAPIFGPNSSITADTPQMTYDLTPTI